MHLHNFFQTKHTAISKLFTGLTEPGNSIGACKYEKIQPINLPKCHRKNHVSLEKSSKSSELYYLEPGLYLFIKDIVVAMNTLNQERHNHRDRCFTVNVSRRTSHKCEIYPANEGSRLAFLSMELG